jgi:hypothetical protein
MRLADLSDDERALLREVLLKRDVDLAPLVAVLDHVISDRESGRFTHAVGDELVDTGMNAEWVLNERGRRLDRLLSRVNSVRLHQLKSDSP